MKASAIQRNVHISARKAGLVCDLIRNKKVTQAITILENDSKKTSRFLKKILESAIANATNNHAMNAEALYIYNAIANQGRTLKRALPRAKGSSNMIRKRHCHLEIILSDDILEKQKDLIAIKAKKTQKKQQGKKAYVESQTKDQKRNTLIETKIQSKSATKPVTKKITNKPSMEQRKETK